MSSPVWFTEMNTQKRDLPSSLRKRQIRLLLYKNFIMRKTICTPKTTLQFL